MNPSLKSVFFSSVKPLSDSKWLLVVLPFLLFLFLFFRNAGVYPLVHDEYLYSQFARLLPFSEAYFPNYLYYLLYRPTNWCGDGFLVCMQFLNCFFYVAAFFPIYAIARRLCSVKLALYVSTLAILAPFSYFTAFFMVEAPFFLAFFLFVWWLLIRNPIGVDRHWVFSGLYLGLISLVKVNGFFLFPAVLMYLIYSRRQLRGVLPDEVQQDIDVPRPNWLLSFVGFFTGLLLAKLGLAWLMAGPAGLTLGGMYMGNFGMVVQQVFATPESGIQSSGVNQIATTFPVVFRLWGYLLEAFELFFLNLFPVCFIFPPIVGSLFCIIGNINSSVRKHITDLDKICILTALLFINLLLLAVAFTWIAVHFGGEAAYPHRRYYELAYPLLLLCSVGVLTQKKVLGTILSRSLIGVILAVAIIDVFVVQKSIYWYTDWFEGRPIIFYIWVILSTASLVVWIVNSRLGSKIFLWALFPLLVLVGNVGIDQNLKAVRMEPNASLKASLFIRQHLSESAQSRLMVAGYEVNSLSAFYLKDAKVPIKHIAPGIVFSEQSFLPGKDWVLLMGNAPLDPALLQKTHQDLIPLGYATLFGGHGIWQLDFKQARWPAVVQKSSGIFFPPEPWGTWTLGDTMQLQFSTALPRKFELTVRARAFGPNIGKKFYVELGQERVPFILKGDFQNITVEIDNPLKLSTLLIRIPHPVSPRSLGIGQDERQLGMAIEEIQVKW
jgi:phosphoglycerol transferase